MYWSTHTILSLLSCRGFSHVIWKTEKYFINKWFIDLYYHGHCQEKQNCFPYLGTFNSCWRKTPSSEGFYNNLYFTTSPVQIWYRCRTLQYQESLRLLQVLLPDWKPQSDYWVEPWFWYWKISPFECWTIFWKISTLIWCTLHLARKMIQAFRLTGHIIKINSISIDKPTEHRGRIWFWRNTSCGEDVWILVESLYTKYYWWVVWKICK